MSTHPDPTSSDRADSASVAIAPATIGAALPAIRDTDRHDGWTPDRQAAFLRELAATHNVAAAARAVGMSRQSAYKLRARMRGEPFDAAWDAAFQARFNVLAEAAMDRAMNGVEVPHYHNGELIGTSRRYDERLTLALLAMRRTFDRPRLGDFHASSAFEADDLVGLIERVEKGPENWLESSDAELDARYKMDEDFVDEGGTPRDVS